MRSCRKALKDLPTKYKAIYVMNADVEGKLLTLLPGDDGAMHEEAVCHHMLKLIAWVDWWNIKLNLLGSKS